MKLSVFGAFLIVLTTPVLGWSADIIPSRSIAEVRRQPMHYAGQLVNVQGLVVSGEFHRLLTDQSRTASVELRCPDEVKGVPTKRIVHDERFKRLCQGGGFLDQDPTIPRWMLFDKQLYSLTAMGLVRVEKCRGKPCSQVDLMAPLPIQLVVLHVLDLTPIPVLKPGQVLPPPK